MSTHRHTRGYFFFFLDDYDDDDDYDWKAAQHRSLIHLLTWWYGI